MHWAAKYIGLPHRAGGRGPDAFDCWGIVWLVYQKEFGIILPEYPGVSSNTHPCDIDKMKQDWTNIILPFEGCGVGLGQTRGIHHAGIYIQADGDRVLHCWGKGVCADTHRNLKLKGFRTIKFYRHKSWPT